MFGALAALVLASSACPPAPRVDDLLRNLPPAQSVQACHRAHLDPAVIAHWEALDALGRGDYPQVLASLKSATALPRPADWKLAGLRLAGDARFLLGDLDRAEADYRLALKQHRARPRYLAHAHKDLGIVQREQGRYLEALRSFKQARRTAGLEDEADVSLDLSLRGNLGSTFRQLGLPDLARAEYELQLGLALDQEAWAAAFDATLRLAYLFLEGNHPRRALKLFLEAESLTGRITSPLELSWLMQGMANAHFRSGDVASALEAIDRTIELETGMDDPARLSNSHSERGEMLLAARQVPAAKRAFETAADLAPAGYGAWRPLAGLAEIALLDGRWQAALNGYRRAVAEIDDASLSAPFMYRSPIDVAARCISLLVLTGEAGDRVTALALAERVKQSMRPDASHRARDANRDERLRQIDGQLSQLASAASGIESAAGREPIQRIQQRLVAEQTALLASLGDHPSSDGPPFSVFRLQQSLASDEIMLVYNLSEMGGVVFLLTPDRLTARPLELPHDEIRNLAQSHRELLSGTTDYWKLTGRRLYDALIGPIAGAILPGAGHWIVIGDPALSQIPLDTLIGPDDRLLLESRVISTGASAGQFMAARQRTAAGSEHSRSVLFAGHSRDANGQHPSGFERALMFESPGQPVRDIPAARGEVRDIAARLSDPRLLVDDDASETSLRRAISEPAALLHIASHAVASHRYPGRSAILLGPPSGTGEDGLLTLAEIMRLDLRADLVVLSACETQVQPRGPSQVSFSLADGLLNAGARSVVGSLWKVEDRATAEFMRGFYHHLARGLGRGEALAATKRDHMLKSHPGAHPAAWASFVLIGEARPPVPGVGHPRQAVLWLAGGLAVLAGVLLAALLRRRTSR